MASVTSYGVEQLLWDSGWSLHKGINGIASATLNPTASLPAVWILYNNTNELIVEEIRVHASVSMVMSIYYSLTDPSLAASAIRARKIGGGAQNGKFETGVQFVGNNGHVVDFFVNADVETVFPHHSWLSIDNGAALILSTPLGAATVTSTFLTRGF